ncbi:hypothetical protein Ciccas_004065 [Cichlidogyrus casuarinus]|uniref:Uncharacterized protein n=1 Tax=Cichlidogyrus casuarinus TaxID=1844966 RepID=A0ABD2QCK9_9PLAT
MNLQKGVLESQIKNLWLETFAMLFGHVLSVGSNVFGRRYLPELQTQLVSMCTEEIRLSGASTGPTNAGMQATDVLLRLALNSRTQFLQSGHFNSLLTVIQESPAKSNFRVLRKVYTALCAVAVPFRYRVTSRLFEALQLHMRRMLLLYEESGLKPSGLLVSSLLIEWLARTKISSHADSTQPKKRVRSAQPFRASQPVLNPSQQRKASQLPNLTQSADQDLTSLLGNYGSGNETSTSLNASRFSLHGMPGTSLASDPSQVDDVMRDVIAADTEVLSFADHGLGPVKSSKPQRPIREIVGLVENAISFRTSTKYSLHQQQLLAFWLRMLADVLERTHQWALENRQNELQFSEANLLIRWCHARIEQEFEKQFIVTIEDQSSQQLQLGLHDSTHCPVAISFGATSPENCFSTSTLPQILRILSVGEMARTGNLFAINAMLGCPLLLIKDLDALDPKELLALINWLRGLVNVFSRQLVHTGLFFSTVPKSTDDPLKRNLLMMMRVCLIGRLNSLAHCMQLLRAQLHLNAATSLEENRTSGIKTQNSILLPTTLADPLLTGLQQTRLNGSFLELLLWKMPSSGVAKKRKLVRFTFLLSW